ncbi:MAG: hypothetical protein AAF689_17245 [Pseudomonadota bacterium]
MTAISADVQSLSKPFLACFCAGALYGWSALASSLQARFDTSTADVGLVFSLAIVSFTAAVLVAPHLGRWRTGHVILGTSAGVAAISVGLAAMAASFTWFLAFFSLGFAFAAGAIYSTVLRIGAATDRPWLATPIMVAAFGLGGVAFSAGWTALVAQGWGINALAVLAAALILVAIYCLADRQGGGLMGKAAIGTGTTAPPRSRRMVSLLWGVFALGSFPGLLVLGLAGSIMEHTNAEIAWTGAVLAGVAAGNTVGRLAGAVTGAATPKMGLYISVTLSAFGLIVALTSAVPLWLGISLIVVALGYGLMAATVPLATTYIFGVDRFQSAFGIIFTAWGLAGFIAPWLAGRLHDIFGSFAPGFALALVASLGTLPLIYLIGRAR